MTKRQYTQTDRPFHTEPTEAERTARAIRKVTEARAIVVALGYRWMEQFQVYRQHRDAGRTVDAHVARLELEQIEAASSTAEWLLELAERAHKKLAMLSMLVLAFLFSGTAHAYQLAENTQGTETRWDATEVVLRVDPALEDQLGKQVVRDALDIASDAWRGYGEAPSIKISLWPATRGYEEFTDESAVVWGYGYPWKHELAMTLLRFNERGSIRKATIAINPEYAADLKSGKFDLASVLAHECGHVLGLNHSEHPMAVMGTRLDPHSTKQSLTADDEQGIEALYPETHLRIASGGCSAAGDEPVTNGQLAWWFVLLMLARAASPIIDAIRRRSN